MATRWEIDSVPVMGLPKTSKQIEILFQYINACIVQSIYGTMYGTIERILNSNSIRKMFSFENGMSFGMLFKTL